MSSSNRPDVDPIPAASTPSRGARVVAIACLVAAIGWSFVLRDPLIVNAPVHLDSDLAVDGLTLRDAVNGHWRWNYPGTPHIGSGPILLSFIQAKLWGTNAEALVSGGAVAHALILVAVFSLAWRVMGPLAAAFALLPLTAASTGLVWLSGRITGGHLLIVAWSGLAWLLFHEAIVRRSVRAVLMLGACCGLGIWLDSMFLLTLGGIGFAWICTFLFPGESRGAAGGLTLLLVFFLAFAAGLIPKAIGRWADPYDAYNEQFAGSLDPALLAEHGRILSLECLPRLIAGHRLPGLESDPDPSLLGTGAPIQKRMAGKTAAPWWAWVLTPLSLGFFLASLFALVVGLIRGKDSVERSIFAGILATSLAVVAGFLVNKNIFNSDNYRYLVLLLIPWALGFGRLLDRASRSSVAVRGGACAGAILLAALFTADAVVWYRRMGWIDDRFRPVRQAVDDRPLAWLEEHPEIDSIFGGYWDVYRLAFLSRRDLEGVPYPIFPNRFPEWSHKRPGGRPETMLARGTPEGRLFLEKALREGGRVIHQDRGLTILHWPSTEPAE